MWATRQRALALESVAVGMSHLCRCLRVFVGDGGGLCISESRPVERFTSSASGGKICLVKASLNSDQLAGTEQEVAADHTGRGRDKGSGVPMRSWSVEGWSFR